MPKPSPKDLDLIALIRAEAGVPADDVLSLVENRGGQLTVRVPESLGGVLHGDFAHVTIQLSQAVHLRRRRNAAENSR